MRAPKAALDENVDELRGEMLDFLASIVRYPSVTGEEAEAQRYVAGFLRKMGLLVDVWDIREEDLKDHEGAGAVTLGRSRPVVVGVKRGSGGGRSILLNGHIDVVEAGLGENWTVHPWQAEVKGDYLYGRGSCDMKGGLTTAVFALAAVMRAGIRLRGDVVIQSVPGEEDGGVGTLACIHRGYVADAGIIPEPTRLAVGIAQAGCVNFRVVVRGLSAHGCMRDEGVSAVEKFYPVLQALLRWERQRNLELQHPFFQCYENKVPISIGTVRAGSWNSTVPELLVAEGRAGMLPGESPEDFKREMEEVIVEATRGDPWLREHPPEVEWLSGMWEPAELDPDHPFVLSLAESFRRVTGEEPKLVGVTYGSDMRLFTRYGGVPTVLFGPGDVRRAHFPDEYVPISEVTTAAKVLAELLVEWCGVA